MTETANSDLKYTFPKSERLHSKKLIEELFNEGSYFYLYPFRVTYLFKDDLPEAPQVMFSVSKRKFKSAVHRNRIKRLMREAYRLNKHDVDLSRCLIGVVYTSDDMPAFSFVEKKLKKALNKLSQL
ncbi:ribonuclease P protein component [Roseivirga sp.]|uniref:ribonuclease P protein component n=1 Tax=Roseivirga sp. TaxID=1964215 RepID=UPI003B52B4F2